MFSRPRTPSDHRNCWLCSNTFYVHGVDNITLVDRKARQFGWRYLEWRGRMICPECIDFRRRNPNPLSDEIQPF